MKDAIEPIEVILEQVEMLSAKNVYGLEFNKEKFRKVLVRFQQETKAQVITDVLKIIDRMNEEDSFDYFDLKQKIEEMK